MCNVENNLVTLNVLQICEPLKRNAMSGLKNSVELVVSHILTWSSRDNVLRCSYCGRVHCWLDSMTPGNWNGGGEVMG